VFQRRVRLLERGVASKEDIDTAREQEEYLLERRHMAFHNNLGHIVYNGELPEQQAVLLKDKVEKILGNMPQNVIEDTRLNLLVREVSLDIIYEPSLEKSNISHATDNITIYLARDIIYQEDKVDTLTLQGLLSEFIASVILDDYRQLKQNARINENAWFKLEIIKALLNYRDYMPLYHKLLNRHGWTVQNYWDGHCTGHLFAHCL